MKVNLRWFPSNRRRSSLRAAQATDELDFYVCYSADEIYHKDAWLLIVAAARRTQRIRLGPCVAAV